MENLAIHMPKGVFVSPANEYVESPAWSAQSRMLPYIVQEEVDCGNVREVLEIDEGF